MDMVYDILDLVALSSNFGEEGRFLSTSLNRLTARSLTADCYDELKRSILNLELLPGTILLEQQIASQLGVSKTPVREAIARLNGEGLVITDQRRRSLVSGITAKSIRDLYHARVVIEPEIVRELTCSLSESDAAVLFDLLDQADQVSKTEHPIEFVDSNEQFHMFFVSRSGNNYLKRVGVDLSNHVHRVRAAVRIAEQELGRDIVATPGNSEHRQIAQAVASGDADNAASLMKSHIHKFLDLTAQPFMQSILSKLSDGPIEVQE